MPRVTGDFDSALESIQLTRRVVALRNAYFRAIPEICGERPILLTQYHAHEQLFGKARITPLEKAKAYRYVLQHRTPVVFPRVARDRELQAFDIAETSLFIGSTTSHFKGVQLYPEMMALALWPELHSVSTREQNPYYLDAGTRDALNRDVFPKWMDESMLELARKRPIVPGEPPPNFDLFELLVFFIASKPNCVSHTIPDFSRAIGEGLQALILETEAHCLTAKTQQQAQFYEAMGVALQGIIAYSHRLADEAEKQAEAAREPQKTELIALAKLHRRVPESKATTFREGLITVWMCWTALHLENANVGLSLGRLDQLLYPLYRADMDSGRLTLEEAVELLCCLWLKIGDHVPSVPESGEKLFGGTGSNQAITIGGVDRDGRDAVNELTYVILRATELMLLRDPNLNARYMPGTNPPSYLKRLCRANVRTRATPALHNDRAVITALMAKGESLPNARNYGIVGCVEPSSAGRHYGHSGALLLNLPSVLELTLFNGHHRHTGLSRLISTSTGDPRNFESMDEFRSAFTKQLSFMAREATNVNNSLGQAYVDYYPSPTLSALFEGPLQKGKDISAGGASGNSSGVTIIGLADVADSLSAIERLVFGEPKVPFEELIDAVKSDFTRHKALLARLANPKLCPTFGNEDPLADGNARWLVEVLDSAFSAYKNVRGGQYRVGYWTMTNHAGLGALTLAMPSGRRARQNFASGITPRSGTTPELLAALHSVASLPAASIGNGMALNLKFVPEACDSASLERMVENFRSIVEGYFAPENDNPGGMEIQFNVTSSDDLRHALKNPEELKTLLVRVSGYTAYFKDLPAEMQQEIITRTQYLLSTGHSVPTARISIQPDAGIEASQ